MHSLGHKGDQFLTVYDLLAAQIALFFQREQAHGGYAHLARETALGIAHLCGGGGEVRAGDCFFQCEARGAWKLLHPRDAHAVFPRADILRKVELQLGIRPAPYRIETTPRLLDPQARCRERGVVAHRVAGRALDSEGKFLRASDTCEGDDG